MQHGTPQALALFAALCALALPAGAAEICDNCADDDGDGLVDCYDTECRSSSACQGSFLDAGSPPASCAPVLSLADLWTTLGSGSEVPAVGDIDADGMPEVVLAHEQYLYVFDGASGRVERRSDRFPYFVITGTGIADVDGDGTAEIFIGEMPDSLARDSMSRYENDLSPTYMGSDTTRAMDNDSSPGFADFDGDGRPEVYQFGVIYDPADGHVLVDAGNALGPNTVEFTLAADVLDDDACDACAGLELIGSSAVVAVDLAAGTYEVAARWEGGQVKGSQALADWTGDGRPDIIVNTVGNARGLEPGLYIWDPRSGALIAPPLPLPHGVLPSVPLVADFDGDPDLEIAILVDSGGWHYAIRLLDHDLSAIRDIPVTDNSEWTTPTAFDFDMDGTPEIVHRGTTRLTILSAGDGSVIASAPCTSGTSQERTVVADVNADGQADVLAACDDGLHAWTVVGSAAARRVSNQWHYAIASINDDLTVPCHPQNQAAAGLPSFMNSWMLQAPLLIDGRTPAELCNCPDPPMAAGAPVTAECAGTPLRLDAAGSSGCSGRLVFRWIDAAGAEACGWSASPDCDLVAGVSGAYTLQVACADDETCRTSLRLAAPSLGGAIADAGPDRGACPDEVLLLDASASVVATCPSPEYRWRAGSVVLRDYAPDPTVTVSPHDTSTYAVDVRCGGSVPCLSTDSLVVTVDSGAAGPPIGGALRAHDGTQDSVGLTWCLARPLSATEHVHVRRSARREGPFELVAPLPDVRDFRDCAWTDPAAPEALYFYLVSYASCAEMESE